MGLDLWAEPPRIKLCREARELQSLLNSLRRLAPKQNKVKLLLTKFPPHFFFFFALDGKFPGVATLELSNPPGVGTKEEDKCPVLRQHCNIFH